MSRSFADQVLRQVAFLENREEKQVLLHNRTPRCGWSAGVDLTALLLHLARTRATTLLSRGVSGASKLGKEFICPPHSRPADTKIILISVLGLTIDVARVVLVQSPPLPPIHIEIKIAINIATIKKKKKIDD